jgi:hypothetical protein
MVVKMDFFIFFILIKRILFKVYIYKVTNLLNGKVYIGKTVGIRKCQSKPRFRVIENESEEMYKLGVLAIPILIENVNKG